MFPSSFSGTKKFPSDSGASATVRTLEATYSMEHGNVAHLCRCSVGAVWRLLEDAADAGLSLVTAGTHTTGRH